ncbi:Type I restriction enzyme HsdR N-terminal domain-containing protein [Candidatus Magnetomoraceae bacterium gMMP-15]
MSDVQKSYSMITDFITGKQLPDIGSEDNRQEVERFLVEEKEYPKDSIEVDVDLDLIINEEAYHSQLDLVVTVDNKRFMLIKCAAGSLGSREREAIAAARLLESYQMPFSVVSDGKTAILRDTVSGKKKGEGLNIIPSYKEAIEILNNIKLIPFPEKRMEREKLVFRTYDSMNVNVQRNVV